MILTDRRPQPPQSMKSGETKGSLVGTCQIGIQLSAEDIQCALGTQLSRLEELLSNGRMPNCAATGWGR
jgi:hypothetical protein